MRRLRTLKRFILAVSIVLLSGAAIRAEDLDLETAAKVEVKLKDFYQRHRTKFIPIDPQQDPLFKAQQQSEPEALFGGAIEDLCRLAQERGLKPVLLYLPALDEALATNAPAILSLKRGISRKLNLPLVDLTQAVQAGGNEVPQASAGRLLCSRDLRRQHPGIYRVGVERLPALAPDFL